MCGLGNYSRLACELYFVRSLGYYVIHIYIPSSLIVVLSWVSFWLHRDAAPARVALGVTTVLTMTTLISSTNAALPKISYLKSIDVYLVTCFVMVFAAILEYAAVSYIGRTRWPVGRRFRHKGRDLAEWTGDEETAYFRLSKGRKGDDRWRTHLELEIKVIAANCHFINPIIFYIRFKYNLFSHLRDIYIRRRVSSVKCSNSIPFMSCVSNQLSSISNNYYVIVNCTSH